MTKESFFPSNSIMNKVFFLLHKNVSPPSPHVYILTMTIQEMFHFRGGIIFSHMQTFSTTYKPHNIGRCE